MKKTIVFIRHAHRDTSLRSQDNGLSAKGQKQAHYIKDFFKRRQEDWDRDSCLLLSSPKKRCLETLAPLAQVLKQEVIIREDLNEQGHLLSLDEFEDKIKHFLRWWKDQGPELCIVCSHGDLLPLASFHLLGVEIELKKGSWLEVEWADGRAKLQWYISSFKFFSF